MNQQETRYLRFPNEETWLQKSRDVGFMITTENDNEFLDAFTHEHSIDVIGEIWNNDGVYDEETFEVITPPTKKEGFHINYKGELPEDWEIYEVNPSLPHRVFFQ